MYTLEPVIYVFQPAVGNMHKMLLLGKLSPFEEIRKNLAVIGVSSKLCTKQNPLGIHFTCLGTNGIL